MKDIKQKNCQQFTCCETQKYEKKKVMWNVPPLVTQNNEYLWDSILETQKKTSK